MVPSGDDPAQNTKTHLPTLVFWGTYDKGKPRNRILLDGLRACGVEVTECHVDLWRGVEDKSQLKGLARRLSILLRWLVAYPVLIVRYLRLPAHDVVVIGYMGQLDVLVLWPWARLRGVPVIWDVLMSLYVATVEDRGLLSSDRVAARGLYAWEWLAFRAADRLIMSNLYSANYLRKRFRLKQDAVAHVLIGAETDHFPRRPTRSEEYPPNEPVRVLFYGTFIPSHGVGTIIDAARRLQEHPVHWTLIGNGQEAEAIDATLSENPMSNLTRIDWVPYADLVRQIHLSDICLGIFGAGERASHALANKIFQILASGTPLVTRDSPAIRQVVDPSMPGIYLIPPADPAALANAVLAFARERDSLSRQQLHLQVRERIAPRAVAEAFLVEVEQVRAR
jgi:glycosyltransferase involved in cell wall biosynthesis